MVKNKEFEEQNEKIKLTLDRIKHKVAVMSGKGGVGKTSVTVNLAAALAAKGLRVGVLDADIHGPNVPKMFGLEGQKTTAGPAGIFPVASAEGITVMSMSFLLSSDDTPVIWRGPLKMGALRQFVADVAWGDLDYLVVDLPPGTGDEPLTVMQTIPLDGVVIVSTPQDVALLDSRKTINMAKQVNVPVLGLVENMAGFVCPECGTESHIFGAGGVVKAAERYGLDHLGSIPLSLEMRTSGDAGNPLVTENPDATASQHVIAIAEAIQRKLNMAARDPPLPHPSPPLTEDPARSP